MKRLSSLSYTDLLQCKKKFYWTQKEFQKQNPNHEQFSTTNNEEISFIRKLLRKKFGKGIEITNLKLPAKRSEITFDSCKTKEPLIYDAYFKNTHFTSFADLIFHKDGKMHVALLSLNTRINDLNIDQAAFTKYVIEHHFGLSVHNISIIFINKDYVREEFLDAHELFKIEDVTDHANGSSMTVSEAIKTMHGIEAEPNVDIGPHCTWPVECQFKDYCWKHIPKNGSVFNLRRMRSEKKFDLYKKGIIKLVDIPDDYELNEQQREQVQIAKQKVKGTLDFQKTDLSEIQDFVRKSFKYPMHFLEIYTWTSIVPSIKGYKPYKPLTFAYSIMVIEENGNVIKRKTFLPTTGKENIALEFTKSLLSDISDTGNVASYISGFVGGFLIDLQNIYPEFTEPLQAIIDRMVDLHTPFRRAWLVYSSNSELSSSKRNISRAILHSEYYSSQNSNTNTVQDISFQLNALNLEELEEAWNMNLQAGKRRLKPLFTFNELGAFDRTIYEQISNPLVLRLFLELFHGKSLPKKSAKRLNIWNEWFFSLKETEQEFLTRLAKEIWRTGHNELLLDDLLKIDFFKEHIGSGNISSPYNRLKNKGWISRYMKGLNSHISFTVEASLFHVISRNLLHDSGLLKPEWILNELQTGTSVQKGAIESYLCETVVDDELQLLSSLIDVSNSNDMVYFVRPLLIHMKIFGVAATVSKLHEDESSNDWVLLNLVHDHMERTQMDELRKDLSRESLISNPLNDYHSIKLALNSILYLDDIDFFNTSNYLKGIYLCKYNLDHDNTLLRGLGQCHLKIREYDKAITYFKECMLVLLSDMVDQRKALSLVYGDLGKVYLEQNKLQEARDYFEKALEMDGDNTKAVEMLAAANEQLGDAVAALNDYIRLCEMRNHLFGSMHELTQNSIQKVSVLMAKTGKKVLLPDWFYSK